MDNIKIVSEIIGRENLSLGKDKKIEKVSKHSEKFMVMSPEKTYYVYIYKDQNMQTKEKEILELLSKNEVKVPNIISSGNIKNRYYNVVTEVPGVPITQQMNLKAEKLYKEIQKMHAVKKNGKSVVHGDLCMDNIILDSGKIGFVDFSYAFFGDPLWDYSYIYLKYMIDKVMKSPQKELYEKLWKLIEKTKDVKKRGFGTYIDEFVTQKRFSGVLQGKLLEHIRDDINDTVTFMNKRTEAVFDKRKWIGITSACNNRCIFCLDGEITPFFKKPEEVHAEISKGVKEGCTRLVISGGEATIHPQFIDIIREAKKAGYKKVQVISNGRMFSYSSFLRNAVNAGLDEITFSIHGHTSQLHEKQTHVKGSFRQTVQGIKRALSSGIIVSCDIVINKSNVCYLPEMMFFLLKLGVREFDLLHIMPYGRAWDNRNELMYELSENIYFIRKAIDIAESYDAVIWTNRLPAEYLEGYERYIQDPIKLMDEIMGRKEVFMEWIKQDKKIDCFGKRCSCCVLQEFCRYIDNKEYNFEKVIPKRYHGWQRIYLSKNAALPEKNQDKKILISILKPEQDYETYQERALAFSGYKGQVQQMLDTEKNRLFDIPRCFVDNEYHNKIINRKRKDNKEKNLQIGDIAQKFIMNKKVKSLRCKTCAYDKRCEGVYQKYIMNFGFKELQPVRG